MHGSQSFLFPVMGMRFLARGREGKKRRQKSDAKSTSGHRPPAGAEPLRRFEKDRSPVHRRKTAGRLAATLFDSFPKVKLDTSGASDLMLSGGSEAPSR